jgi:sugar (pentulose or hexulose) kinase
VTARQKDLLLAIDVGTGSVRAALFTYAGRMLALAAREHDQIVPGFGRAEQRPADWWDGRSRAFAAFSRSLKAQLIGSSRSPRVDRCMAPY